MTNRNFDADELNLIRFTLNEQIEATKSTIIYYDSMIRTLSETGHNHAIPIETWKEQKSSKEKHLKDLERLLDVLESGGKLTMSIKKI